MLYSLASSSAYKLHEMFVIVRVMVSWKNLECQKKDILTFDQLFIVAFNEDRTIDRLDKI